MLEWKFRGPSVLPASQLPASLSAKLEPDCGKGKALNSFRDRIASSNYTTAVQNDWALDIVAKSIAANMSEICELK